MEIFFCIKTYIYPFISKKMQCDRLELIKGKLYKRNDKLDQMFLKGWLAIAKLKPLSLFISLLSMPKKAFDNVKIEK